jgi:hypothetical protein
MHIEWQQGPYPPSDEQITASGSLGPGGEPQSLPVELVSHNPSMPSIQRSSFLIKQLRGHREDNKLLILKHQKMVVGVKIFSVWH